MFIDIGDFPDIDICKTLYGVYTSVNLSGSYRMLSLPDENITYDLLINF